MHEHMDAAGAVDAQHAPTAPWKTAQNAVSHSAHTHFSLRWIGRQQNADYKVKAASHTKSRTLPSVHHGRLA
jgi:hypothetical protein